MRLTPVPVVLGLAVMALAAGCGGSSGKQAAATSSTGATEPAATVESTTTEPSATVATTKNCDELLALGARMTKALQATSGDAETDLARQAKAFEALAKEVPSEIRGDFEIFASSFDQLARAMAKVGIKPGVAPTPAQIAAMQTTLLSFSTPKLQAAEQHISAWAQKHCGAEVTTTTTD